jgi:hypothetical protein
MSFKLISLHCIFICGTKKHYSIIEQIHQTVLPGCAIQNPRNKYKPLLFAVFRRLCLMAQFKILR